jgi:predicted DNA-binding WGR domain protein
MLIGKRIKTDNTWVKDGRVFCMMENTDPGHNKFYKVFIQENPNPRYSWDKWLVYARYGKIGTPGVVKIKARCVDRDDAEIEAQAWVRTKARRGYEVTDKEGDFW